MHRTILSLLFAVSAAILAQAAEPVRHEPADYPADAASYRRLAREVERHWREDMLAHWFPRAVDREHGGFLSELGEDWTPGKSNDKTIVYQARMTWVAAQVAMRHPELREEFLGYTRHGVDCLAQCSGTRTTAASSGASMSRAASPTATATRSTSTASRSASTRLRPPTKRPRTTRALDLAKRAFAWLERHAHDPEAGGYREALRATARRSSHPPAGRRATDAIGVMYGYKSMNSHIHLFEAMTELYGVWPDPLVRTRLEELLTIVRDKVAVAPGCLNLFFTRDWRPVPDHDSFGHDVETTYLLLEAAEALHAEDEHTVAVARSLVDHALAWGWDETNGGFYDKGAAWSTGLGPRKDLVDAGRRAQHAPLDARAVRRRRSALLDGLSQAVGLLREPPGRPRARRLAQHGLGRRPCRARPAEGDHLEGRLPRRPGADERGRPSAAHGEVAAASTGRSISVAFRSAKVASVAEQEVKNRKVVSWRIPSPRSSAQPRPCRPSAAATRSSRSHRGGTRRSTGPSSARPRPLLPSRRRHAWRPGSALEHGHAAQQVRPALGRQLGVVGQDRVQRAAAVVGALDAVDDRPALDGHAAAIVRNRSRGPARGGPASAGPVRPRRPACHVRRIDGVAVLSSSSSDRLAVDRERRRRASAAGVAVQVARARAGPAPSRGCAACRRELGGLARDRP